MGLFDFARNIGNKLLGSEDEDAEDQGTHRGRKPRREQSRCQRQRRRGNDQRAGRQREAMEKAVLMAGNVKGIGEVRADGLTAPAPVQDPQYYDLHSGDTLSAIAKKYYGNASDYPRIFEANREVIKDANLIYPGQKIRIPMGSGEPGSETLQ